MSKTKKMFTFNSINKKLGDDIFAFSIDRERSCLCASDVCREICYGGWNRLAWTPSVSRFLDCYERSLSADFAREMLASLEGTRPVAFRIHDVGDFYSRNYARKWTKIVRARPDIMFFAYTRVWILPELVPELQLLSAEPNMTLLLSLDHSMPCDAIPPELANLPRAWLATNDDDIPSPQLHVVVVFRNLRGELPPLENINHFAAMVCLAETGRAKTTCRQCKFCWSGCKKKTRRTDDAEMSPVPRLIALPSLVWPAANYGDEVSTGISSGV